MARKLGLGIFGLLLVAGCSARRLLPAGYANAPAPYGKAHVPSTPAEKIVADAHRQATEGTYYDASYQRIPYPNGDVPAGQGACTDVVIRALRAAGYDLQALIHKDISAHFEDYPRREAHPDANIDHRRVPNQMYFFHRFGKTLTKKADDAHRKEWQPGDIVCWKLPSGLDHTGVVSDTLDADGWPLVIHNMSRCAEQDVLRAWPIQGHYRYPK